MGRYMFVVAILSLILLSACNGATGKSANADDWGEKPGTAYYEKLGVLMDYPSLWTTTESRSGTFTFVPPVEDADAVRVSFLDYGSLWGYERCSWSRMSQKGSSFEDWVQCYRGDFLMNGGYLNISVRSLQEGNVQIIEAFREADGKDYLFAFFSGTDYSGENRLVEVRYQAVPEKYQEYLPIVEQMIGTLRSSR